MTSTPAAVVASGLSDTAFDRIPGKLVGVRGLGRLIGELASQGVSIERASRLLEVSAAGYFAWRSRPPSERAIRHAWLTDVIRQVHADSFQTHGARRVYAELTLGRGLVVGRGAVELLMGRAGLYGLPGPRKSGLILPKLTTAGDLVTREFSRAGTDQLWVTDIERHEALSNRVGVGDFHRRAVAAAG